jgi:hypothetical protein
VGQNEGIRKMENQRNCLTCKGTGQEKNLFFTSEVPENKRLYGQNEFESCDHCGASGVYPAPNVEAILDAVIGRKGVRSAKPKETWERPYKGNKQEWSIIQRDYNRTYYVWRMARFHGGVDMTLPFWAGLNMRGDPYVKELDFLVDALAKRAFGTDKAAAVKWGRALGYV